METLMCGNVGLIPPLPDTYEAVKTDMGIDPEKIMSRRRTPHNAHMLLNQSMLLKQKPKKPRSRYAKSLNATTSDRTDS